MSFNVNSQVRELYQLCYREIGIPVLNFFSESFEGINYFDKTFMHMTYSLASSNCAAGRWEILHAQKAASCPLLGH